MNFRLLVILFSLVALAACEPNRASVPSDQLAGDQIVTALEKYKAEQGHYPNQLSELMPSYISQIKSPQYGEKRWDYNHQTDQTSGKDSFGLYMWGQKAYQDGYLYSSDRRQWEVVKNSF